MFLRWVYFLWIRLILLVRKQIISFCYFLKVIMNGIRLGSKYKKKEGHIWRNGEYIKSWTALCLAFSDKPGHLFKWRTTSSTTTTLLLHKHFEFNSPLCLSLSVCISLSLSLYIYMFSVLPFRLTLVSL